MDEPLRNLVLKTLIMLRRAVLTCVVLALAVGIAAAIVPGIDVKGGIFTLLWVGLLFGLVNAVLGPILHLISLPLTVITLGLFALVVNGVLLATTAGISDNLDVGGFIGTILGALIISIITAVLALAMRPRRGETA
jgi:putative membrane protein